MNRLCPLIVVLLVGGAAFGQPGALEPKELLWPEDLLPPFHVDDPHIEEILKLINSVSAYEVPALELKRDHNYAQTPVDYEPFGGVTPFKEHFLEQMEYTGPGRAIPEPEHVDAVRLGFIGPIMSTVSVATGGRNNEEPLGIQMMMGTRLAIEQANARGGYLKRSVPFELVVANDNGLWGSSGNEIIDMAYKDGVWAILGTIDGANSHIAIRVALKAEMVMINTGDTDPTFIETNIPWVMRNINDDRQMGYLLLDYLFRKRDYQRVALIRASSRYARFGVREITDGARRLGRPITIEMAYAGGTEDFSLQLERMKATNPDAIVHWGPPREGGLILRQMREMGMDQPYFASDRHVSREFVEAAGEHAEGAWAAFPWDPRREDPKLAAFREAFRKRFGVEPDTYAAHAYDGMNLLIWAVQVAGLNRAKIRDVLAHRAKPWPGVTGDFTFTAALDRADGAALARFEGGAWDYFTREELEIPQGYVPSRDRVTRGAVEASERE